MAVGREDGHVYVKGAAEAILPLCALAPGDKSAIALKLSEFASRGLRLLAVASGPEEKGASKDGEQVQVHEREGKLHFLGLLALADPPRPEVIPAVQEARRAGITSVMITGDHPQTAIAIARELGLVLEGEDQADRVHARATPEDKLKLVRLWKEKGAIVAMTGDGVNDAPALREAHVGIAMGLAGTEVTRQAADIVLADDNFATIVAAVREGRGIFDNIRKSVTYLLTGNLAEIVLVMGAVALDQPLPLLALHLLWINLVTDALPALALIADPIAPHIMSRPPRPSGELILGSREWIRVVIVGSIEALVSLLFYGQLLRAGTVPHARSLVFSTLVLSQLLRAFCARSDARGVWRSNPFGNPWLVGVAMFTGGAQLALHSFPPAQALLDLGPISIHEFSLMISLALIPSILIEGAKLAIRAKDVPK
jgi:Ca2+-transporting ATPase